MDSQASAIFGRNVTSIEELNTYATDLVDQFQAMEAHLQEKYDFLHHRLCKDEQRYRERLQIAIQKNNEDNIEFYQMALNSMAKNKQSMDDYAAEKRQLMALQKEIFYFDTGRTLEDAIDAIQNSQILGDMLKDMPDFEGAPKEHMMVIQAPVQDARNMDPRAVADLLLPNTSYTLY